MSADGKLPLQSGSDNLLKFPSSESDPSPPAPLKTRLSADGRPNLRLGKVDLALGMGAADHVA